MKMRGDLGRWRVGKASSCKLYLTSFRVLSDDLIIIEKALTAVIVKIISFQMLPRYRQRGRQRVGNEGRATSIISLLPTPTLIPPWI